MGTNYYLYEKPSCPTCGHLEPPLHIGKSSYGWCFSLHVIPERGLTSFEGWKRLIESPGVVIKDECGNIVTATQMLNEITNRKGTRTWDEKPIGGWDQFHTWNNSEQGPNYLLRHRIDGQHCIGHGDGTYDYIAGEFL